MLNKLIQLLVESISLAFREGVIVLIIYFFVKL